MKKVISGKELKEQMKEAVSILYEAVSKTLGPMGNNVLINTSETSPFITNDGVTIARSIESEDKVLNTILEILKEASLKTNETVGDGTTTTLVLLEKIFNLGLEEIEKGKNPMELKKELEYTTNTIISFLETKKRAIKEEEYHAIAALSANDQKIGSLVSEVFQKVLSKYSIRLEESPNEQTYYEIKKGYCFENNMNDIYFEKAKELYLDNCSVLIVRGYLESLEEISIILNEFLNTKKALLILVEDCSEEAKNDALLYHLNEQGKIFLCPLPNFASRKISLMKDIEVLTNSKSVNLALENITWENLGKSDNIIIKKENITIINENDNIKNRVAMIKEEIKNTNEDYEREFLEERASMLERGIAYIYVGGVTKPEKREKIMRFEDAICALETAKKGVVPGEGLMFLEASATLKELTTGDKILKESLTKPFEKILSNSGISTNKILPKIQKENYQILYNIKKEEFESIKNTKIIDPYEVLIETLKNAVSIATILLTTTCLVINEIEINKEIL